MERYREVMFALSESAVNHASRINSYYRTLSGNHGRKQHIFRKVTSSTTSMYLFARVYQRQTREKNGRSLYNGSTTEHYI